MRAQRDWLLARNSRGSPVVDLLHQLQPDRLRTALADRYQLERKVGEGGMAAVYLARDLRHGRQVALKVLRAELAASLGPQRFLREIRVVANLQHPHILPLFDSGSANGFLYYVMPFVDGESLRHRLLREPRLPLQEALRIARETAREGGSEVYSLPGVLDEMLAGGPPFGGGSAKTFVARHSLEQVPSLAG